MRRPDDLEDAEALAVALSIWRPGRMREIAGTGYEITEIGVRLDELDHKVEECSSPRQTASASLYELWTDVRATHVLGQSINFEDYELPLHLYQRRRSAKASEKKNAEKCLGHKSHMELGRRVRCVARVLEKYESGGQVHF